MLTVAAALWSNVRNGRLRSLALRPGPDIGPHPPEAVDSITRTAQLVARRRRGCRLTNDQKDGLAKLRRGGVVLSIYRWLIEVAFLFAAFSEFPQHKWSIGLGLLAFSAGVQAIGHTILMLDAGQLVRDDAENRKTRHAIVLASEAAASAAVPEGDLFWREVSQRVEREYEAANEYADTPVGPWLGFLLGSVSFVWQLAASLAGIGIVAALTH